MIWKYLNQRYPSEGNKWNIILPISLFVGLFMVVFQPFGLSGLDSQYKIVILSGYGLVTFVILSFNLFLLPAIFPKALCDENWTVLKEILFMMWVLFTLGLSNLLYSSWTMGFRLSFTNALFFQVYTLAIGIIPVSVIIIVKQNYLRRKNEGSAGQISSALGTRAQGDKPDQPVRICSENEKDSVETTIKELLYIRSDGNYITVGYLRDGRSLKAMLRNTLKYASELLSGSPSIYQCHRSWLVNLDRITRVTGNSQGWRIEVEGFDEDIPVARNQASEFKERITRIKG